MAQNRISLPLRYQNGGTHGLLDSESKIKPEGRDGDKLAQAVVVISMGVFVLTSWVMVLASDFMSLSWFALHVPLQTLAVGLFVAGVVTLQPTSQPKTKAAGLARHQMYIWFLGVPSILLGTWAVYHNKEINARAHAVSWHGTLGFVAVMWMFVQVAVGGGSVWFGGAAFGGGMKAKSIWKYHRVSGYLLLPLFLYVAHLGGQYSSFSEKNSSVVLRFLAYSVAPLLTVIAVFARVRSSKMNFSNLLR